MIPSYRKIKVDDIYRSIVKKQQKQTVNDLKNLLNEIQIQNRATRKDFGMICELDRHRYRPIRRSCTAIIRLVYVTFVVCFYIIEVPS